MNRRAIRRALDFASAATPRPISPFSGIHPIVRPSPKGKWPRTGPRYSRRCRLIFAGSPRAASTSVKRKSCAFTRSSRMVAAMSHRSHHGPPAPLRPPRRTRANTSRPSSFVRASR